MKANLRLILLPVLGALFLLAGCKKLTEEHNAVGDPALKKSLMQLIDENPDLSTFAGFLRQTGLDKELSSSKSFTVFAPQNSQMLGIDQTILTDAARLKKLIGNHIAGEQLRTTTVTATYRVKMLSGKYLNMQGTVIGDVNISKADQYAPNGILQIVDNPLPALDNCWEYMLNNTQAPIKQKNYVLSLFRNVFDPTNAVVIGINPSTGDPIYQPGTDSVFTNLFWNRVFDLRDEKKQFTYFMLTDGAWDTENTKYAPYFPTSTPDSSAFTTSWNVVRDFAVDTVYNPANIPDTILSKDGTKLGIDRAAIVRTVKTSNGIVYVMSKLDVMPLHKFKTIILQAENYNSTSVDRRGNTYFRDRFNTATGFDFRDMLVLGHGVAQFNVRYQINEMPAVKYKAYWMALNDFQTATHQQRLAIGGPTAATFAYVTVPLLNYNEVYLGEFINSRYWPVYNVYLVAANSTTAAVNPIVCDYIKLVPGL